MAITRVGTKSREGQLEITLGQVLAKLLLTLTLVTLVVSAWLFVSWLYKPGNFPIRKVELVNKLENQDSTELQQIAAGALNGGFFSLNVEQFRTELLTKLPWIKSVSVRKIWPNKLLVSIAEHQPVVRWLSVQKGALATKGFELLSNEGIVFRPNFTTEQQLDFAKMALLTGPQGSAGNVLKRCYQISESLQELGAGIKQCGMNERRTWMLVLNNGIDVKLGKENIMRQLDQFIRVFSGQLNQYLKSVDYVDLRYSNGFSVKWNSDSALQTENVQTKESAN